MARKSFLAILLLLALSTGDAASSKGAVTEDENQLVRPRRSAVSEDVQSCYLHFVVGRLPPTGFRNGGKPWDIRYICQQVPKNPTYFYSTMFDQKYGLPIYSAYVLKQGEPDKFRTAERKGSEKWREEPGISPQGSDDKYVKQKTLVRGHLLPAEIYSISTPHMASTFTYTNAAPQVQGFNSGVWETYETKIRKYAKSCSSNGGDLYLITGISEVRIDVDKTSKKISVKLERMKPFRGITVPNSFWTAGCCVNPTSALVIGAFAGIGNNLKDKSRVHMSEMAVKKLESLLAVGVKGIGLGVIELFPGNRHCNGRGKLVVS